MKRPERPEALFAVLVAVVALLAPSSVANAATTANGDAMSADKAASAKDAKKADAKKADTKKSAPKDPSKLRAQLSDLSDDYKKAADRLGALEKKQATLTKDIRSTSKRLEDSRKRVAHTAQAAYTSGNVDSTVVALTSNKNADDVIDQMTTLTVLAERDDVAISAAQRDRARLQKQQKSLKKAVGAAKKEQADLAAKRKKLNAALLEAARAAAKRANGKASRGAKITNGGACPIGSPYTVMNTFGAARGGGRSHEGVDIPAPKSTPIYAVEDGTISRAYSNTLGGLAIILKGKSGDSYYYAHQEANLVRTGQKVVAGEQIAKVGMTGDAQGTIYHLHFERWPGGGNPVDPYSFVVALCGKKG